MSYLKYAPILCQNVSKKLTSTSTFIFQKGKGPRVEKKTLLFSSAFLYVYYEPLLVCGAWIFVKSDDEKSVILERFKFCKEYWNPKKTSTK